MDTVEARARRGNQILFEARARRGKHILPEDVEDRRQSKEHQSIMVITAYCDFNGDWLPAMIYALGLINDERILYSSDISPFS